MYGAHARTDARMHTTALVMSADIYLLLLRVLLVKLDCYSFPRFDLEPAPVKQKSTEVKAVSSRWVLHLSTYLLMNILIISTNYLGQSSPSCSSIIFMSFLVSPSPKSKHLLLHHTLLFPGTNICLIFLEMFISSPLLMCSYQFNPLRLWNVATGYKKV